MANLYWVSHFYVYHLDNALAVNKTHLFLLPQCNKNWFYIQIIALTMLIVKANDVFKPNPLNGIGIKHVSHSGFKKG